MNENSSYITSLQRKVAKTLLKNWDPIGIQDIPEAQDEYDSYAYPVVRLLTSGKSEREVFDHLWRIETEHMGLFGDKQKTEAIAKMLLGLLDEIIEKTRQSS